MRYLKVWKCLFPFILAGMTALTGCGDEEAPGGVTDVTGALFLSEETQESDAENGPEGYLSGIAGAETDQGLTAKAREITEEEKSGFEAFLNEPGNYGFLLSVYERPQELDAEQVFFTGAGLTLKPVTDEEREAYLEKTGREEAVNLFGLSAAQISEHLLYKAGIALSDLSHKPGWVYLEDYDTYYQCHADEETNLCTFEVTDGAAQGDYYRIHYRPVKAAPEEDGWHTPCYEVILKKNGDGFRFLANRLWMEKDLLVRTYMRAGLNPGGYTSICAYSPDPRSGENADVTFALIQKDEVKCILPGMNDTNIRKSMIFGNVRCIDTGDYDSDGRTEILTICRYQPAREWSGRNDRLEARIYRLDDQGMPALDKRLTRKINRKLPTLSISAIEHYIRTGKIRPMYENWKEAFAAELSELDPEDFDRFALIYIDDNRVPELLEMGNSPEKGARIMVYHDGVLEETKVNRDFSYLRKENLVYCKNGTGNVFTETLYIITGGRLGIFQNGYYGTRDAAVTSFKEDGSPDYSYQWEGSEVSGAGYREALHFLYDTDRAVRSDKIKMMSLEDIRKEIQ